jgi:hypothetical protein
MGAVFGEKLPVSIQTAADARKLDFLESYLIRLMSEQVHRTTKGNSPQEIPRQGGKHPKARNPPNEAGRPLLGYSHCSYPRPPASVGDKSGGAHVA